MSRNDERVDIDIPFMSIHVGGSGQRIRFGDDDDGEDVIDMETHGDSEYRMIRRNVRKRLRFFRHAFFFIAANSVLFLVDWATGGGFWVQWVALIWGVFLGLEFVSTFLAPHLWGRDAEKRMIERELRRRRGGA